MTNAVFESLLGCVKQNLILFQHYLKFECPYENLNTPTCHKRSGLATQILSNMAKYSDYG